jgi:transcriptional antiterminator RfaH
MARQWYALRSKPRKEDIVWKQIRSQGFEHFYPRMRVHPVNPRARKVKPYFPGYLFVRVDLDEMGISTFQWMPHALGIVSFDREPASVPDHLIQALKKRIKEIAAAGGEVFDGLEPGDKVRIHAGPFRGYEAVFDASLSGNERVRVLLQFIDDQRIVPIELSPAQIRKMKGK